MKPHEANLSAPDINVNNIRSCTFADLMAMLQSHTLVLVPNGTREEGAMEKIDYLLGYFANTYTHLMVLWAQASHDTNRAKAISSEEHAQMNKKKEALYEVAQAVKLKHAAVSRMLTVKVETDGDKIFDSPDLAGRADRAAARTASPTKPAPKQNGWGGLG